MRHVPHLYLPPPWEGGVVPLSEDHRHHLSRVLRMDEGQPVTYTDGVGNHGVGSFSGDTVVRGDERAVPRPTSVTVVVPPPHNRSRVRFLVEKLAELGVVRLDWVRTRRSEGKPPPDVKARAWAVAALEQSRGGWLMEIGETAVSDLDPDRLVVADPDGTAFPDVEAPILLVGPEGGLAPDELPSGCHKLSLGPTILRVETAAIIGASLLRAAQPD